jgi:hypothetical protein
MPDRTLIAERNPGWRSQIASLSDAGVLKSRRARRISSQSEIACADEVRSAGCVAHRARFPVILVDGRKNQISLKLVTLAPVPSRRGIAGILQIIWLEQHHRRGRLRMAMHPEHLIAGRLYVSAHVVLHEDAAVAAPPVPVACETIAVNE